MNIKYNLTRFIRMIIHICSIAFYFFYFLFRGRQEYKENADGSKTEKSDRNQSKFHNYLFWLQFVWQWTKLICGELIEKAKTGAIAAYVWIGNVHEKSAHMVEPNSVPPAPTTTTTATTATEVPWRKQNQQQASTDLPEFGEYGFVHVPAADNAIEMAETSSADSSAFDSTQQHHPLMSQSFTAGDLKWTSIAGRITNGLQLPPNNCIQSHNDANVNSYGWMKNMNGNLNEVERLKQSINRRSLTPTTPKRQSRTYRDYYPNSPIRSRTVEPKYKKTTTPSAEHCKYLGNAQFKISPQNGRSLPVKSLTRNWPPPSNGEYIASGPEIIKDQWLNYAANANKVSSPPLQTQRRSLQNWNRFYHSPQAISEQFEIADRQKFSFADSYEERRACKQIARSMSYNSPIGQIHKSQQDSPSDSDNWLETTDDDDSTNSLLRSFCCNGRNYETQIGNHVDFINGSENCGDTHLHPFGNCETKETNEVFANLNGFENGSYSNENESICTNRNCRNSILESLPILDAMDIRRRSFNGDRCSLTPFRSVAPDFNLADCQTPNRVISPRPRYGNQFNTNYNTIPKDWKSFRQSYTNKTSIGDDGWC